MNVTITPEIAIGTLTLLGAIILAVKKSGWITIGPAPERRDCAKKCSEHEKVVAEARIAVANNAATTKALSDDIQDVKDGISDLRSEVRQIEQNTQSEFRQLREMIGALSGYIKGLHDKDN